MIELQEIFEVHYGTNLELNKLTKDAGGVNFVSRTAKNNGVSCRVEKLSHIDPIQSGVLSVAGGGSVLETFLQEEPFYSGRDLYYLVPRLKLSKAQKLYYCMCIRANKYRYNYGRQANKTLKTILVPSLDEIPSWVNNLDFDDFGDVAKPLVEIPPPYLDTDNWRPFRYSELFEIERGKGPRKKDLDGTGETPVVTSSDQNNGWTAFTTESPCHNGGTLGVNRNGSVGESFYQPVGFCSTEDVHIFTPKFEMNKYVAMFLSCLIRVEKYRFNYGRKWGIARMEESIIKLPVNSSGDPDWDFMENYIKSLPYSSSI